MKARDGFILDPEHRAGCFAVGSDGPTFLSVDGPYPWGNRDTLGRMNGGRPHLIFCCQDPSCPARLLVRWDVLGAFLDAGAPRG